MTCVIYTANIKTGNVKYKLEMFVKVPSSAKRQMSEGFVQSWAVFFTIFSLTKHNGLLWWKTQTFVHTK